MRTGYKKTEVGVIPEMWEVASLNMLTSRATGVWGSNVQDERHSHRVEIIRAGDISQDGRLTSTAIRYITPKELEKAKCSFDDLVITTSGNGLGKLWWCDGRENTAASNFVRVLHPFPSKVNGQFLAYALRTNEGIRQLKEHTATSAYPNLRPTYFSTKWVPLPHLAEQIAIATALSDVDGLLSGLDRLIAKKRDLKQAAMQQLLTGETRLPGFNSEWRKVKISDLCEYVSGTKTSGGDKGYVEIGDVDVVRKSYSLSQKEKLSVPGAVSVPAGTLLISTVRPTRGAIAITNESCYVSSAFCRLRPVNGLLFHLVCQPQFLAYLGENAIGGTYPTCRDETILDYETSAPLDHQEQIAIATLLFDMDAELAALEARRDKIQALKQGMMQELLTGRIRLLQPEALHA